MAHVNFDGLNLRLTLTAVEKAATGRLADVVIPRGALASVVSAVDIWSQMQHGITPLGVGHKGIVFVGTALSAHGKDFCLIGKHGPGLVVHLRDWQFDRLLLSLPPAELWPLYARLREVTQPAQWPDSQQ